MASIIRRLTQEEFGAYSLICSRAYPGSPRFQTEEGRQKFTERLAREEKEDPRMSVWGLFRGDALLGAMKIYDYAMTFVETQVPVGGVGMIAVDLMHKKEHVCKEMVTFFLERCRQKGQTIAMLYPFRPDFYLRMGFGFGTKMNHYRFRPASLPEGSGKEHLRFSGAQDAVKLIECYNRYAEKTHGMIQRSGFEMERYLAPGLQLLAYWRGDRALGWLAYNFVKEREDNFLLNDLHIRGLVYEDEALGEILTYLNSQLDQAEWIILNTQDEDFHHLLSDPRNGSGALIPPAYHESNTQAVGLMYRVTDVRGFFSSLAAHDFGGQDCRLKLTIADTFLPPNQGGVIVYFQSGKAMPASDGDFDVEVSMNIPEFSSLAMGVVDLRTLVRYGLARISANDRVETVARLFRTEQKPVCMTDF